MSVGTPHTYKRGAHQCQDNPGGEVDNEGKTHGLEAEADRRSGTRHKDLCGRQNESHDEPPDPPRESRGTSRSHTMTDSLTRELRRANEVQETRRNERVTHAHPGDGRTTRGSHEKTTGRRKNRDKVPTRQRTRALATEADTRGQH